MILVNSIAICDNNGISIKEEKINKFKFWIKDKESLEEYKLECKKALSQKLGRKPSSIEVLFTYVDVKEDKIPLGNSYVYEGISYSPFKQKF